MLYVCVCVCYSNMCTHTPAFTPVSSASSLPSHPSGSGLRIPEQPLPVTSITLPQAVTLSPKQASVWEHPAGSIGHWFTHTAIPVSASSTEEEGNEEGEEAFAPTKGFSSPPRELFLSNPSYPCSPEAADSCRQVKGQLALSLYNILPG